MQNSEFCRLVDVFRHSSLLADYIKNVLFPLLKGGLCAEQKNEQMFVRSLVSSLARWLTLANTTKVRNRLDPLPIPFQWKIFSDYLSTNRIARDYRIYCRCKQLFTNMIWFFFNLILMFFCLLWKRSYPGREVRSGTGRFRSITVIS